tara:strand:+ start:335 stop:649 length:315 start_codon:yes stop_codon:yes gene_type:complete
MKYDKMIVKKSDKEKKKYVAVFTDSTSGRTKQTHFGQAGAPDYILTKDKERRSRYRSRHKKDLQTKDPTRAGYLSLYLLWSYGNENSTSLRTNLASYKKRFKFK